ncbi:MAG: formylglycine-generating enzyme family protein [Candidatus Electrothrix sp. AR3]|nr:formylglycine-generating enzyme family protein [Candidatus Electrothrix sp. AR3]
MKNTSTFIGALLITALPALPPAQAADYSNSLGMEFTNIPAGSFYMGSCMYSAADKERDRQLQKKGLPAQGPTCPAKVEVDKDAAEEEAPQHEIRIRKSFQMGVYEVTLGQFNKFLETLEEQERDKIETKDFKEGNAHDEVSAVTQVSWEDVQKFIRWLNHKEGTTAYRLPTEAEWEYAARAGTDSIYFWGDEMEPALDYAWFNNDLADLDKWFKEGDLGKKDNFAHPVGLKKANPWGLHDITGNVWEWVQDWYSATYYHISPDVNPTGPQKGKVRCFRGGSWYGSIKNLRSAFRGLNDPTYRSDSLGFRLVREQKEGENKSRHDMEQSAR